MIATTSVIVTAAVLCNMHNYTYSPRCTAPVATIEVVPNGFHGRLESDVYWEQYWIDERTMRFELENVCWEITKSSINYSCGNK